MLDPLALPDELRGLAGRIIDTDTHEMIPVKYWIELFGPECQELHDAWANSPITDAEDKNTSNVPDYVADDEPIDATIVNVKGSRAPGAYDLDRRLDVMDAMGVASQLMFPTSVGLWAAILLCGANDKLLFKDIKGDRVGKAKAMIRSYNRWLATQARRNPRIVPVAPVFGDTVEELTAMTRELLDAGIKAVWMPFGIAPGGKSPAHHDLDPYWQMLVDNDCILTLHVGTEETFFESMATFRDASAFKGYRRFGETSTDPWYLTHLHLPVQNFLMTMTVGGVFVRNPRLRVLVAEVGGYWVGPMMQAMDVWQDAFGKYSKHDEALKAMPSSFIRSNVRVTPFCFEDVAGYIGQYRQYGLEDVMCFSTDYPHVEGGKDALRKLYSNLAPLGSEVIEKFFVTNGAFVMPQQEKQA